jgi:pimeloyl-ACP methyl ester carboxylesterase
VTAVTNGEKNSRPSTDGGYDRRRFRFDNSLTMYRRASHRAGGRPTRWTAAVLAVATTVATTGVLPTAVWAYQSEEAYAASTGLPVVLVHGLNSSAQVWQDYTGDRGFLASLERRGFAVGDGQVSGVPPTATACRSTSWPAPT